MLRLNLHRKVLGAFLLLALIPLAFLAFDSFSSLRNLERFLGESATRALDQQASRALQLQAVMVAGAISDFLREVEGDLHDLARLPRRSEDWQSFSRSHWREVWYRAGTNAAPREVRETWPLYREIAFLSPHGLELLRLRDEQPVRELRDLSDPRHTTFRSEEYFQRAVTLPPGGMFVGPVTGRHVSRDEQLRGAATTVEAVEGAVFDGVIRFAMPVHDAHGRLEGVLVLSLNHRHLMEFTQHLTPDERQFVVFPSYDSGNYAFQFDHEGWMIAHPKYWDIRGVDAEGRWIPPYTEESSAEEIARGLIPFNLFKAGFVHPNYPFVAREVLAGRSGVVDVTNIGGSHKVMAYAPIFYRGGNFADSGIFGGVTIGAELNQFHKPALETSAVMRQEITRFVSRSWLLASATVLLVFLAAYALAGSITRPLLQLIAGTKAMARGDLDTQVVVSSHDEVGELATSFNAMAQELKERRAGLLNILQDLRRSRHEILRERNFKETVFEHIETGILTLDAAARVTFVNGPACRLLRLAPPAGETPLSIFFSAWPELLAAVTRGYARPAGERWSEYVVLERSGEPLTFRLALLLLSDSPERLQILTIEDLTERVQMRQRAERMDRLASLGRMAAGIAHEVRNPLTGISLLLDELHDRSLDNPGAQQLLRRALGEIERLEGLVSELLNFAFQPQSRLERGDVAVVLSETLVLFRKQCERHGVTLEERIAADLPPVPIDAAKLRQALLNLLTNALEAMPGGGTLTVTVHHRDGAVQVAVSDTGAGIPPERLPLLFEPFYTTKGGGTGLGLAITHNIISEHGGRIEVSSQPGQGASFTVVLPAPL